VHCVDNEAGDQYIMREYMAYKLYQVLSPYSYRVQLLRVKYRDTQSKQTYTRYAILLEDEDELAERLEGKLCEDCYGSPKANFRENDINTHDLFQYLIGNTDWDHDMLRNVKLLTCQTDSKCVLVPYDFDFSGFVNTAYASVDSKNLGVQTVQQRVFLGFAQSPEEMKATIELFQSKQKELESCIRKFKFPLPESKIYMLNYLESFYKCLNAGLDLKNPGKC